MALSAEVAALVAKIETLKKAVAEEVARRGLSAEDKAALATAGTDTDTMTQQLADPVTGVVAVTDIPA